ncbi:MAG TPA: hypothetical protein VL360_00740 [Gammaproteobacteria bacterium]|jgi:hypothetical protein|nr:hypothetical protein [Gammaproteobacteria bacterium]
MQSGKKTAKKSKGRIGLSFLSGVVPSMLLMEKTVPSDSLLDRVKNYIRKDSSPEKPQIDVDTQINSFKSKFVALSKQIEPLNKEIKDLLEQIKAKRAANQEVPLKLKERIQDLYNQVDLLKLELVKPVAENIREHAVRRIDLFFLLLIAVYKQNVEVIKAETILQHGKGSDESMTRACHSSLFPCLTFKKIEENSNKTDSYFSYVTKNPLWSYALDNRVTNTAWSYATDNRVTNTVGAFFQTSKPKYIPEDKQLLLNTHFAQVLNSTMMLPTCVNEFDCHIEKRGFDKSSITKISLKILDQVSRGIINPINGLNMFCDAYYQILITLDNEYVEPGVNYEERGTRGEWPQTFAEILKYQIQGVTRVMRFYDEYNKEGGESKIKKHAAASYDYIYLNLGLYKLTIGERLEKMIFSSPVENKIFELQEEILKTEFDPEKYNSKQVNAKTITTFVNSYKERTNPGNTP